MRPTQKKRKPRRSVLDQILLLGVDFVLIVLAVVGIASGAVSGWVIVVPIASAIISLAAIYFD